LSDAQKQSPFTILFYVVLKTLMGRIPAPPAAYNRHCLPALPQESPMYTKCINYRMTQGSLTLKIQPFTDVITTVSTVLLNYRDIRD